MPIQSLSASNLPQPGDVVGPAIRQMTAERILRYADCIADLSAVEVRRNSGADTNIHNDQEFARSQGLSRPIADGMISTNWILSLLVDKFGANCLGSIQLRTKYIAPIYEGQQVQTFAKVVGAEPRDDAVLYTLEVWCEVDARNVTVGDATLSIALAPAR